MNAVVRESIGVIDVLEVPYRFLFFFMVPLLFLYVCLDQKYWYICFVFFLLFTVCQQSMPYSPLLLFFWSVRGVILSFAYFAYHLLYGCCELGNAGEGDIVDFKTAACSSLQ